MSKKNRLEAIAAAVKKSDEEREMKEIMAKLDMRKAKIKAKQKEDIICRPKNSHGSFESDPDTIPRKRYKNPDQAYIDGSVMMENYNATKSSEWD